MPSSNLHLRGYILTISTHSGPQYVHHFEVEKDVNGLNAEPDYDDQYDLGLDSDESETIWSSSDSDSDTGRHTMSRSLSRDIDRHRQPLNSGISTGHKMHNKQNMDRDDADPRRTDTTGGNIFDFESGFLAEILCPPREMCNQRFEMYINDFAFLGIPVHILPGGTWRELKRNKDTKNHSNEDEHTATGNSKDNSEGEDAIRTYTDKNSPLRMFHFVLVLCPPITRALSVTESLYRHITVPFTRMLRHEQASKNYIWNQVQLILKAREEGLNIEGTSELAKSMKDLFTAVANMEIARLQVCSKPRTFQIPFQLELRNLDPSLPLQRSQLPGSYLCTSNLPVKEIGRDSYECYGLLLLDDPEVIVQEIQVETTGPVAAMIRNIRPTMSIKSLSQQTNIDIRQIVNLAYSLVYWRRARIIIPLHHRHIYGVSPLTPLEKRIPELVPIYSALFPMAPPLSRLLSALSNGRPQPYIFHIPTRDHREVYMQVLAWMLQHNLVVHLPTFALIIATRKVKLAVLHQQMTEEDDDASGSHAASANGYGESHGLNASNGIRSSTDLEGTSSKTHPFDKPGNKKHNSATNPKVSSTDNSTKTRQSSSPSKDNRSKDTANHTYFKEVSVEPTIIVDPVRASLLEKRWINQTASGHSEELSALFHRLSKYLNGVDCLEQICMKERLTRAEMKKFLLEFTDNLVSFRHW